MNEFRAHLVRIVGPYINFSLIPEDPSDITLNIPYKDKVKLCEFIRGDTMKRIEIFLREFNFENIVRLYIEDSHNKMMEGVNTLISLSQAK